MLAAPTDASSFDIGLVTDDVHIPLEKVKPIFVQCVLEEETSWNDVIGLSAALDDYLLEASTAARSGGILFVDAKSFKSAYQVRGKYTVTGPKVVLRARLFKGPDVEGEFRVEGDIGDLKKLVEMIMEEIRVLLPD